MKTLTTENALQDLFVINWDTIRQSLKEAVVKKLYIIRTRYLNGNGDLLSLDKKEEALRIAGYQVTTEKQWNRS